ncbi:MAG: sigma-E factor negative regulatory protein [Porticoccaceae bacterium]
MAIDTRIEETLSALMDGEAEELEVRRALREVSANSDLRATWHRYQLASAAMKRDLPGGIVDLSSRIGAALEQEAPLKPSLSRWLQPLGKVAIAASVALVAVIGVQQIQNAGTAQPSAEMASRTANDSGNAQFQFPAGYDLPPVTGRTVSAGTLGHSQSRPTVLVSAQPIAELADEEALRDYFNSMMQRHTESAARSSSQGLMPFARLPQGESRDD